MSTKKKFHPIDYPKITEALTLTKTVRVDCSRDAPLAPEAWEDTVDSGEGWVTLTLDGNPDYYGNLLPGWAPYEEHEKLARERCRVFTDAAGDVYLEIKFIPGFCYFDEDESKEAETYAQTIYEATNLASLMTLQDFTEDVLNSAPWTSECFGEGGECYEVAIEAMAPGYSEAEVNSGGLELYLGSFPTVYKGQPKEIHVGVYQD